MAFLSFPSPTQLRNLENPSSNQDAATKAYVDAAATASLGTLTADVDEFTGDGTTLAFSLSGTPASKNVTFVVVQGIMQPKSSYELSGAVLTFSSAPPNTAFIEVTTMKIV